MIAEVQDNCAVDIDRVKNLGRGRSRWRHADERWQNPGEAPKYRVAVSCSATSKQCRIRHSVRFLGLMVLELTVSVGIEVA